MSKANSIHEEIALYFKSKNELDNFTKHRIQKQIRELDDVVQRKVLSALYQFLCGEIEQGIQIFVETYNDFGCDCYITMNHIYALVTAGLNKKSIDTALYYAQETRDPQAILKSLDLSTEYCNLDSMDLCFELLLPMEAGLEYFKKEITVSRLHYDFFNKLFISMNISRDDVTKTVDIIFEVMKSNKADHIASRFVSCDDEYLDIEFTVNQSIDTIIKLNDDLIDAMVELDELPSRIIPRFTVSHLPELGL